MVVSTKITEPTYRAELPPFDDWTVEEVMAEELKRFLRSRMPMRVLELGSGLSTILMAYELEAWGGEITAIENRKESVKELSAQVRSHQLTNVGIYHATMKDYTLPFNGIDRKFTWYYLDGGLRLVENQDFIFIDGPFGGTCMFSRYPALPQLWERLGFPPVIVDDTKREEDALTVAEWMSKWPIKVTLINSKRGGALLERDYDAEGKGLQEERSNEGELAQEVHA